MYQKCMEQNKRTIAIGPATTSISRNSNIPPKNEILKHRLAVARHFCFFLVSDVKCTSTNVPNYGGSLHRDRKKSP